MATISFCFFLLDTGHFKMLTNSMECDFLLTVALEMMRDSGAVTNVKDLKYVADKENLFIARERCEFVNRCVLTNVVITTATTIVLYDVTELDNGVKQKPKPKRQQQQQTTTKTKKPIVSTSKCLTKSSDSEEHNDNESVTKLKAKNIQSTPKLNRLRPRTAGGGTKEFTNNSHKSSINSSSSVKKNEMKMKWMTTI
ncbi:unnamed protein product [Rotaria sp. Silwood1]|nr:unnamed protein product [Rotaria sp. Silwood1]